ncbi:MAG: YecA family protein, partial [Acidimicrobiales bacterium]
DDYVVQLSDRRITQVTGSRQPSESNKGGIILLPDARLVVGYAGVARIGSFLTQDWLLEELTRLSGTGPALAVIDAFVQSAEATFGADARLQRLPSAHRSVSFIISGFASVDGSPQFVSTLASNFQDWGSKQDLDDAQPGFFQHNTIEHAVRTDGMAYVQRIGRWRSLPAAEIDAELKPLLSPGKPVRAVIDKGVQLIRGAAERHADIGQDITAVFVARDPETAAGGEFHSSIVQRSVFMPDTVNAMGHPAVAIKQAEIRVTSADAPPLAVPTAGRNEPCPCGSAVKYKRCHGRGRPSAPPPNVERGR